MHNRKRILIAGDSFSSEQLAGTQGWPVLLGQDFEVDNISSPGIGEYKILQNLLAANRSRYDLIVVSHTSPARVHTAINPLYPPGHLYSGSDIIFADAESKTGTDEIANSMVNYFKYVFDPEYYNFVHRCCCREIDNLTAGHRMLHTTHFDWTGLYEFDNMLNFYSLWLKNRGNIVHYTQEANTVIYTTLREKILECLN